MTTYTVSTLLLEGDKRRPRSQQTELGMSDIGGCRRRAGYVLAGTPPTDQGASIQAVLGTAVDEAVTRTIRQLQAEGLVPAEDLVQHEVRFAGVLGHLDWYRSDTACCDDTKTVTTAGLGNARRYGPRQQHRWQVSLYAAGLVKQGYPVRTVAITHLCRDTGEEWRWVAPFDPALVGEALAWLELVRSVPVEQLPRDFDAGSRPCSWCPFRSACWGPDTPGRDPRVVLYRDDPDALKWARQLLDARVAAADARQRGAQAKGALEAVNPGTRTPVDVGLPDQLLRFNRVRVTRLDEDAVREDYDSAGLVVPKVTTWLTRMEFVPRSDGDELVEVD